ncbi:hypothetical protein SAMN05216371_7599 [Streptomyces sp. TLI_053]|uniref:hypothetical protein n=1 Tax=Streptomyces sp. TLI_053 TaxID=1855352 RepID=UPI00087AF143|nr:hypothetical protein [Streptomyces sp. TLI_053]SDT82795.1 hypothetical protein SAMN05216371_7599 [Streptomyces sp. TLI_053]
MARTTPAAPKRSARTAQAADGPAGPRRRVRPRTAILAALAVAAAALGGLVAYRNVDDGSGERPVTVDEASRLALSRLDLYQASPVKVALTAAEGGDVSVRVEGVVDYRNRRGVGRYWTTGASGPLDHGLVVWDAGGLGLAPEPAGVDGPAWKQAERVPRQGWSPRTYTADPLDAGLQLVVQLGADRPDNPLLLAQSGARRLGGERIDGRDYDRFAGPRAQGAAPDGERSPLTYWVDGEGGLRRVTMRMPGLGTPTAVEFFGQDGAAVLPEAPWLTG